MRENSMDILNEETKNSLEKMNSMENGNDLETVNILELQDEKLLEAFFAGNQMEIEDHGFSDKVMRQLPDSKVVLLQRLWLLVCVVIGIVFLVVSQAWVSLQDCLFASRIGFLLSMSKSLCHMAELLGHSHNLLMMLVGMVTILCVWGYNKVLDARY